MTYGDEKHIDYIIDNFDFEMVRNYLDTNTRHDIYIPTLNELKSIALDLVMKTLHQPEYVTVSSSGFVSTKCDDFIQLDFVISSIDSDPINYTNTYKTDKKQKQRKEKIEIIDGTSSEEKE